MYVNAMGDCWGSECGVWMGFMYVHGGEEVWRACLGFVWRVVSTGRGRRGDLILVREAFDLGSRVQTYEERWVCMGRYLIVTVVSMMMGKTCDGVLIMRLECVCLFLIASVS